MEEAGQAAASQLADLVNAYLADQRRPELRRAAEEGESCLSPAPVHGILTY
jgi:hypothetical protein